MTLTPETRASLLIRVRDRADQAAWHEFVEIYRPVIPRLARQKGLQEVDAEDVAQQVLVAIAKVVEQREHDPKRAKFRTWLHRVAHNAILNALTRGKPDRGTGDSALLAFLNGQATAPPDIGGKWTGEEWDEVVLDQKHPGTYEGTYADTIKDTPGTIRVCWSRIERRYNGDWREGKDRHGKISLRLVDNKIRGAWTTSKKSSPPFVSGRRGATRPPSRIATSLRFSVSQILVSCPVT